VQVASWSLTWRAENGKEIQGAGAHESHGALGPEASRDPQALGDPCAQGT